MQWGWVFCKKVENEGCFFVKIVENGGFVKKGGVLFAKCGPFFNAGCIMYSISIFLHFTYLGGAYVPSAPPCLRAYPTSTHMQHMKTLTNYLFNVNSRNV